MLNGACVAPPAGAPPGSCQATSDVLMNAALVSSPEISASDVAAGRPSATFSGMVLQAVAATLRQPADQVLLSSMRLTGMTGALAALGNSTGTGLIQFDLSFSLCSLSGASVLDPRTFENRFNYAAQGFAAFVPSTVALLGITSRGPGPTAPLTSSPPTNDGGGSSSSSKDGSSNIFERFWWLPWLFAAIGLLVLILVFWYLRRRRLRLREEMQDKDRSVQYVAEVLAGPEGSVLAWLPTNKEVLTREGALVLVTCSFDPVEFGLDGDDAVVNGCLELNEGEVVEVEASGGGWLYGHVVGDPERAGFFPDSIACWIGRPVDEDNQNTIAAQPIAETFGRVVHIEDLEVGEASGRRGGAVTTGHQPTRGFTMPTQPEVWRHSDPLDDAYL